MIPHSLSAIPQTMLWTLYHRAAESLRPDAILKDEAAEQAYAQLEFDFLRYFGPADGSIAARARMYDDLVSAWLTQHPGGTVVELGCGLETQSLRLRQHTNPWALVDLPESLIWRQRLIKDRADTRQIACDCFKLQEWTPQIDTRAPILVTAQGLLMYFPQEKVEQLIAGILEAFGEVEIIFDILPYWISLWTTSPLGFWKTPYYRVPPMPWGVLPSQIGPLVQSWTPRPLQVKSYPIQMMRPFPASWWEWVGSMPLLQDQLPAVVHVKPQGPVAAKRGAKRASVNAGPRTPAQKAAKKATKKATKKAASKDR